MGLNVVLMSVFVNQIKLPNRSYYQIYPELDTTGLENLSFSGNGWELQTSCHISAEKNGLNRMKKSRAPVPVPLVIYVEINLKWFRGVS